MSTKSVIQGLINSLIRSNPGVIDRTEHADVEDSLLNEFFPSSSNYVVVVGGIQYNLTFTKSGNNCNLTGSVVNTNAFMIGGQKLLDIPNSLYYPKTSIVFHGVKYLGEDNVELVIGDGSFILPNSIYLSGGLGSYDIVNININYIVND